jgi:mono/diheme cytochrome c family protein
MRRIANAALASALVLVLGAHALVDGRRRNFELLPEMVYSPAAESFDPAPELPGGHVLQGPVEGTVPRGVRGEQYAPTPADAARADRELMAPPASPADVARGRAVYETFCVPCHGRDGAGDGPVVARGYPAPPSLTARRAKGLGDGRLYHLITYGRGTMPGYGAEIDEADRWRVIAYVRHLQAGASP